MLQRFVDSVLAVTKESVKTITYESLNNIVRLINGVSALLLAILPGKTSILEGLNGWELRQTFGGPRLPRWMEDGVSSFNKFIHELPVESDTSSSSDDDSSGKKRDRKDIKSGSSSSQSSRVNRAKGFSKYAGLLLRCIIYIFSVLVFLVKFLLGVPVYLYSFSSRKLSKTSTSTSSKSNVRKMKRFRSLKDNVIPCATDRRSSIVEELHLAVEVCIETVFDIFHKASHCILAPLDTFTRVKQRFSSQSDNNGDSSDEGSTTSFSMATLSDNDPSPVERKATINHSLDTDARTCKDVITELGYPYEAIQVVTSDGYILTLERIPRRDSRKVVYLQHGVLDSSMGWISNGVVGSPAFAAFDQGYDVFLGNFRGLVSREHINKNISSQKYWRYSVNEHGIEDIPAMLEKIHETKISELKSDINEESEKQPYKLSAICHSLGGAAILMHLITRRIEEKPHRLSRLILLSPAGFHHDATFRTTVMEYLFFLSAPILAHLIPAFYIPTRFFRMLMNKLARDLHNIPAFGGLVQTLMSYVVGGDSSNWVGVMGLPHYNTKNMPGVSFRVALHLAQMKRSGKFMMFDYGNEAENMEIYGSTKPLDLGESYNLIDVPVDLVAGRKDRVIPPSMVKEHYKLMKSSGVEVSFNEFEYAHLDFTFSHHEELLAYVMSRLNGSSSQKE